MNWSGGAITGSGMFTIGNRVSINISGDADKTLGRSLSIPAGVTTNWGGNGVIHLDGSTTQVQNAGTFNALGDSRIDGGGEFENTGTFSKTGGSPPLGETAIGTIFLNSGMVNVNVGNVSLYYWSSSAPGSTYNLADGAALSFGDFGTHTLNNTTITGNGKAFFNNAHITAQGTVNVNNAADSGAGLIDGAGTLIVNGQFDWEGSQWAGTGRKVQIGTNTNANARLNILAGPGTGIQVGRTLDNFGTVNWSGAVDLIFSNNANITNENGATIAVSVDKSILNPDGTGGFMNLAGSTFRKTAGALTIIDMPTRNSRQANIDERVGKFQFKQRLANAGQINLFGTGLDALAGLEQTDGNITFGPNSTLAVTGAFLLAGGSVGLSQTGDSVVVTGDLLVSGGALTLTGGSGGSGATATVSGNGTQTAGTTTVNYPSTMTVLGSLSEQGGSFYLNGARLEADAGLQVQVPAVLHAYGSIAANVTNASEVDVPGIYPSVTLSVTGNYTQTAGLTWVFGGEMLAVSGSLDEQAGTLSLGAASLQVTNGLQIESAAALFAQGTSITSNVTNAGTINFGAPLGTSTGAWLDIGGNYTQTGTGVVNFQIAYHALAYYNSIEVTGVATLAGTVNVALASGYTPPAGYLFALLTYGSSQGQFDTVNLPSYQGGTLVAQYDVISGWFTVQGVPS